MDPLFTLYEADDKHQAIAWGPMTIDKAIDQAVELVAESYESAQPSVGPTYKFLQRDFFGKKKLDSFWMTGKGDMTETMMQLCEWLNQQRGAYRHYFTEEEEGVE